MSLAGGLSKGDLVTYRGAPATVEGPPARSACKNVSVAVRCSDGRILDVRVHDLSSDVPSGGYAAGAQIPTPYGQGNRMLPDRHASQPVGGEVEAGYGIAKSKLG